MLPGQPADVPFVAPRAGEQSSLQSTAALKDGLSRSGTHQEEKGVEPVRCKRTDIPLKGQYICGSNHFSRELRVKGGEYILHDFRLDDERGHLTVSKKRLYLHPAGGKPGRLPQLIHIQWGSRSYLVEPEDLISFCNQVNNGQEPRTSYSGLFLLKKGDWEKKAEGQPKVPDKVRAYVLSKPIAGKIVNVMPYKKDVRIMGLSVPEDGYPVAIDRGSKDGVQLGMRFIWRGESNTIVAYVMFGEVFAHVHVHKNTSG